MKEVRGEVDTYRVVSLVARGRSGEVFRAVAGDGSPMALKVHDRAEEARQEADRLARCDHPAIIRALDHGQAPDGRLWLALPWIEGQTLSRLMAVESPLAVDRALDLITKLGDAVDALHKVGIVHGDLSPNNVLVDNDDRLTLIDLGAGAADTIEDTVGIEVTTTPRYAAPEVAQGGRGGPASDRYAVGLIAYEALTGAFPFAEVATPIAMLAHHAASEPVAASEHRPELPAEVDAVLSGALSKQATDRPPSAQALADELRAAVASSGSASANGLGGRTDRHPMASAIAVGTLVVSAVVVGAVVVGAAALVLRPERSQPTEARPEAAETLLEAAETLLEAAEILPQAAEILPQGTATLPQPSGPVAGIARGLSCNLLQDPDFDRGVVDNQFYGGDPTNTVAMAEQAGVDGSGALRVGADDRFGLYAEMVRVGSHDRFVFSAWVRHDGEPTGTAFYVDYLDEDFVQLTAARDSLGDGTVIVNSSNPEADRAYLRVESISEVVPGAVYAVPTFFKSGSPGSLLVDEVVFGPAETCPDLAS